MLQQVSIAARDWQRALGQGKGVTIPESGLRFPRVRGARPHPSNEVMLASHNHRVPAHRRWTALLLALLFLVTASAQAVHAHRISLPASKQVSDTLDSNAAARCHICLHSQVAPLGSLAVSVSPYVAAEATVPPGPRRGGHAPGEESVHHVRPPPVA